jgi:hypothetical protein
MKVVLHERDSFLFLMGCDLSTNQVPLKARPSIFAHLQGRGA